MIKINQFYILEFKEFLDKIDYSQLLYFVIGNETISTDPLPPYSYVKRNIQRCPSDIKNIMAFLILGENISNDIIQKYLSKECLDYFCKINLIVKLPREYQLNNLVITSYANCYFFVSTPYYYKTCDSKVPSPYIGKDTFWLSRAVVNRVNGRVLDLCTGSGIQSILAAKTSESVCAVDIDSHAIQIATINSYLNGVDDKIEFICGDLYDALSQAEIKNISFDYILSNPPFIPVPEGVNYPICGDGGLDGMSIIRRIHAGYEKHLSEHGTAFMIGQAIGTNKKVFLYDDLLSTFNDMDVKLYVFDSSPLSLQARNFAKLTNQLNTNTYSVNEKGWVESNAQTGGDKFYSFFSVVSKNKQNIDHKLIRLKNNWDEDDIPEINLYNLSKSKMQYILTDIHGNKMEINEEVAYFLKLIDGKTRLNELIEKLPLKSKILYGENSKDFLSAKYGKILYELSLTGLINKKEV